jgi:chemotaxis protein histidine kinase CheA
MKAKPLNERLEEIRKRFISRLDARFDATEAALPLMSGTTNSVEALSATYQRFHQICGTGLTLGFTRIGQAAAEIEAILLTPLRAHRALTDFEVAVLKQALDALRVAAGADILSTKAERGHRS